MLVRRVTLIVALALLGLPAPAHAAFPGENGKIAYTGVFTVEADGSDLTHVQNGDDPEWSPDGLRIAFTYYTPGSCNPFCSFAERDIWTMNGDGSGVTRLTTDTGPEFDPNWSPDGARIVFNNGSDLWIMNADGTGQTLLEPDAFGASWSPDGTRIAFSSARRWGFNRSEIFTIHPDRTGLARVTTASLSNCDLLPDSTAMPDWSPDGQKIVYYFLRAAFPVDCEGGEASLHVVNADGSGDVEVVPPDTSQPTSPAWSPDGSKLTFERDGFFSVWDLSTHQETTLPGNGLGGSSDWQPILNRAPDCSGVAASRTVLATASRKLVPITLDGATDPDGDPVTLRVDGVTQDEPVTSSGDPTSPDAVDEGEGELRVRAERNPRGDGRVYQIAFTASDGRGGSCSDTATVSVPRKKRKPAVDSAPPSYDSFGR
jgi:dipeptidyl aminopeptidase/acylaminoacyl peptidase